jgi:hypothetical protein
MCIPRTQLGTLRSSMTYQNRSAGHVTNNFRGPRWSALRVCVILSHSSIDRKMDESDVCLYRQCVDIMCILLCSNKSCDIYHGFMVGITVVEQYHDRILMKACRLSEVMSTTGQCGPQIAQHP